MKKKLVLIDGHSIINRAFYGVPELTNSEGFHTNGIYGFLNILFKIIGEEKPQYLTVAFDVKEKTFRHELYKDYKGTRKAMPEELREQVPMLKKVLIAMGISIVEKAGLEADDILGTLAYKAEARGLLVSLVSGDRDLLQVATREIKIRIPKTKRGTTEIEDYYEEDVKERYQVSPKEFIDLKALMGDTADNIPGVPGIGEKTATAIITAYHSIENAYAHVEEIKPNRAKESLQNHYDLAQLSKELATIKLNAEFPYEFEQALLGDVFTQEAYELFKNLEFKNFFGKFEHSDYETKPQEEFSMIRELQQADYYLGQALSAKKVSIAIMEENHKLFGVGMTIDAKKTVYIPIGGFVTEQYLCSKLEDVIASEGEIALPNLKTALNYLSIKKDRWLMDCELCAYLLNPLKSTYFYDELAKEFLGRMVPAKEEILGKNSITKAAEEDIDKICELACYEASIVWQLFDLFKQRLKETQMDALYSEMELPLVFVLNDMEQEGIQVQAAELKEYGQKLSVRILELEQIIYEKAGEEFNINSPKQLGVILFEKLNMPNGKKTKTGYSTAAEVLEKLSADYPIVSEILEYRQLTKLKSTYAEGLFNYIGEDGRIHSTFNQTITATGRISSTEPNLQNIPIRVELGRLIRKVFVPKEDYVFLDADYSQIELRVLAHMSDDKALIEAYSKAEDIHRLTASQVFHVPFDEVSELQRRNAKAVNFGIVYGISSFGLSQDLSITRKEAADYIERYFETYPDIKRFLDHLVEEAKETGYAVTLFGRRRPIPELSSSNFMQRSFGERVAMNSPIQGTAADIIKWAMIRVNNRLERENLKSKLVLQVHDELLIETAKDEIQLVEQILEEEMTGAAQLSVQLEIDTHEGKNWYEAK
ncbi:MAG: DNA polymerase I [Lachnospiraceae bacterium]